MTLVREECEVRAAPDGETSAAAFQVRGDIKYQIQDIVINDPGVGEDAGLVTVPGLREAIHTRFLGKLALIFKV